MIAPYNPEQVIAIRDELKVKDKLKSIESNGGVDNLCIMSDFDYTLTRYAMVEEGKDRLSASFSCVRDVNLFSLVLFVNYIESIC